jgi:hypothetical protein
MSAEISLIARLRHFMGGDRAIADIVLHEVLPKLR